MKKKWYCPEVDDFIKESSCRDIFISTIEATDFDIDSHCFTCEHIRNLGRKYCRQSEHDNVEHPEHYCSHPSGIECIEITKHHNFCVGNAIKYLWRCGLKGGDKKRIEDLEKAITYINFEIDSLKGDQHE